MKSIHAFVTAVIVLVIIAQSSHAGLIILGNLPATNDGSFQTVEKDVVRDAVSFTMPPQSYPVQHVALRLGQYNTAAGDVAAVGFYLDNGSDAPGALFGSLLVSPPSSSEDIGQFNFTPSSPLTLSASAKYWLQVEATAGDVFAWRAAFPSITPTSQVGASFGKSIEIIGDSPRDSIVIPNFEIITSIPEPGMELLIVAALGGLAFVPHRRSSTRFKS